MPAGLQYSFLLFTFLSWLRYSCTSANISHAVCFVLYLLPGCCILSVITSRVLFYVPVLAVELALWVLSWYSTLIATNCSELNYSTNNSSLFWKRLLFKWKLIYKARTISKFLSLVVFVTVGVYMDILALQTLLLKRFIISIIHSGSANSSVSL